MVTPYFPKPNNIFHEIYVSSLYEKNVRSRRRNEDDVGAVDKQLVR